MSDETNRLQADFDAKLSTLREANADFLEHLATTLGDGRFGAAAALLRGRLPGRKAIDDAQALSYAESLIKSGVVPSIHKACSRAAALFSQTHQMKATRDRLRKRLRTKLINSEDT